MAELELSALNEICKDPRGAIQASEEQYHAHIRTIAREVAQRADLRAILLAGPSGSGKTTTANLLCDAINSLGEECCVMSLDDFYLDATSKLYPRLKMGELDYESPLALDLSFLHKTLESIVLGKEFNVPKYDFKSSSRVDLKSHAAMPDGCVIIEGLHALNPLICDRLAGDKILKLFVSVSTNVNENGKRIISGRKARFVRRLVRDNTFRGADAKKTLKLWRGVLAAEDIYLYPYKHLADVAFDTFHLFELSVERDSALSLLKDNSVASDKYAAVVITALNKISPIDPSLVPDNSLIREFIGGGLFENIY